MTANAFTQPVLQNIGAKWFRVYVAYTYEWKKDGECYRLVIPAGFECDGGSVPRAFWTPSGIVPTGVIGAAATLHDYIYASCGALPPGSYLRLAGESWQPLSDVWSRYNADRLFCRVMKEAGMRWLKRRIAYRAVRWFGGIPWAHHKKALAARLPA